MKWIAPKHANVELAKDQPEYETIKIRKDITTLDPGDGAAPSVVPVMTAAIQLSEKDIRAIINNGGVVYLNLLAYSWPPASLTTEDVFLKVFPSADAVKN